jgi:excisionase family DNA binding protein
MLFELEQSSKAEKKQLTIEPFVDAERGAEFLGVTRRRVLQMARAGEIPAYPIGRGKRKTWRFRLAELAKASGRKG